jgi:hypothetical protein
MLTLSRSAHQRIFQLHPQDISCVLSIYMKCIISTAAVALFINPLQSEHSHTRRKHQSNEAGSDRATRIRRLCRRWWCRSARRRVRARNWHGGRGRECGLGVVGSRVGLRGIVAHVASWVCVSAVGRGVSPAAGWRSVAGGQDDGG